MKIENGKLIVELADIVGSLDESSRAELVQQLACEEVVIREVMSQVLEGATSEGWYGSRSCSLSMVGRTIDTLPALDWATQMVISRAGAVAVEHANRLQREVDRLIVVNDTLSDRITRADNQLWLSNKVRDREMERLKALKNDLISQGLMSEGDIDIVTGDA